MSEDSIASESLCHRAESSSSLPPRKRLLAGLRQNGWSSASSSSCQVALEDFQVKANRSEIEKHDESSVENGELASEEASPCANESIASDKSKRHRTYSSSMRMKKLKKNSTDDTKALHPEKDQHCSVPETRSNLDDTTVKMESEVVSMAPEEHIERDVSVPAREDGAVEETSALPRRNSRCKAKDGTAISESGKPRRNSRIKKEDSDAAIFRETLKPRRNPSRHQPAKRKELFAKKSSAEDDRSDRSQITRVLSDEELARQLHRIMNSSPRISRCLNYKESGALLFLNR